MPSHFSPKNAWPCCMGEERMTVMYHIIACHYIQNAAPACFLLCVFVICRTDSQLFLVTSRALSSCVCHVKASDCEFAHFHNRWLVHFLDICLPRCPIAFKFKSWRLSDIWRWMFSTENVCLDFYVGKTCAAMNVLYLSFPLLPQVQKYVCVRVWWSLRLYVRCMYMYMYIYDK